VIAIPTGIKIFSWLGTLFTGEITLIVPNLFSLGFFIFIYFWWFYWYNISKFTIRYSFSWLLFCCRPFSLGAFPWSGLVYTCGVLSLILYLFSCIIKWVLS
jgi:hypothetical protein